MQIKSSHPESQGAFVEINDEDFDPETMREYVDGEEVEADPADESKSQEKPKKDTVTK